ncbi:phosphotransferase enzyme family protein [Arsenicitalea aurantiaca]|uniref:phosphotransferase enzyme family protein n=1 Tax=Arsenicitalea aurantiaca TaxID=1783274 RepID=UPI0013155F77|nr:phosphotransferase [Arsenicitalea aurantiaca]
MIAESVEAELRLWPELAGTARLINLSENHTFRIDGPGGPGIIRVHRPGYQGWATIESELAWVEALRNGTNLPVPTPLPGRDGRLVQQMSGDRLAVRFAFIPGREPTSADPLLPVFSTLGRFAAMAHDHVARWSLPDGFVRQRWDASAVLDVDGLWGDWRAAPHVAPVRGVLDALDQRLRAVLRAYGTAPDRFGLIHADMRLANLLVHGDETTLIDFDDCGFCWFLYDLAAALSFIEDRADVPDLVAAWLRSYRAIRDLPQEHEALIAPMILLRRMALLAWIGSHSETDLARSHASHFAPVTAELGAAWLRGEPVFQTRAESRPRSWGAAR